MKAYSTKPLGERLVESIISKARNRNERPDWAVLRFAQERLLFRLNEVFPGLVLKGSFAEVVRNPALARHAPDLDLWLPEKPEDLDLILEDVLNRTYYDERGAVEDGFGVAEVSCQQTHAHLEEPGLKFKLKVSMGKCRVPLKVDFAFGQGHADGYEVAAMRSMVPAFGEVWLAVQPAGRAVAEKLHAMAEFGIENTRVKDAWDIHAHLTNGAVTDEALACEIRKVFGARGREIDPGLACLSEEWAAANEAAWVQWHADMGLPLERTLTAAVADIRPRARAAMLAARRTWDAEPEAALRLVPAA